MDASRRVEPPRSVLVLKPSSFGDIIHTLPAVARLKAFWPDSQISWLANTEWCPLLEGNPVVDTVVPFPRKRFCGWQGLLALPRWLRTAFGTQDYDLVLDYQGLLRTALLGRYAKGKAFLGLNDAREGATWLYDRAVSVPVGVPHAVERYLALTQAAIESATMSERVSESGQAVHFPLPDGDPIEQQEAIQERFVLLHPFARGQDKSLSMEQVRTLCICLQPCQVVLVGGTPEEGFTPPSNCLSLLNCTTLRQLLWLVQRASFVVSVDSGPAHLAAALAKPMVAIHTWSDPRRVGPYLPTAWILKSGELLKFRDLRTRNEAFYAKPANPLTAGAIEAICRLATSS